MQTRDTIRPTLYTVVETLSFSKQVTNYWTEEEKMAFTFFIANHPTAGNVIPATGGLRKIRWSQQGRGKRGGVRVIYYNRLTKGEIWLLLIYSKSVCENPPAHLLRALQQEIENA